MMITDKINFKQPKYVLPAILYPLLLISGYLIFDIFDTEPARTENALQTTEFLNPELPQARVDNNGGIDGKYESMVKSYGRIQDFSAVENIERNNNEDDKEAYESKYTEDDLALLDMEADKRTEELERLREMQERLRKSAEKGEAMNNDTVSLPLPDEDGRIARSEQRRKEALAELDKALAEARLQGRKGLEPTPDNTDTSVSRPMTTGTVTDRNVEVNDNIVHEIADDAETGQVVKKIKTSSDYFHTLAENAPEPKLIKAIIDENIKAVDGSRVRLRLLDDVEINETVVPKGSYLYATMSGFGNQRVKGSVKSILVDDELVKVNLSLYDTDGLEGLYVPGSSLANGANGMPDDSLPYLRQTGEWNSKTTEDYVAMCRERIAATPETVEDLSLLAGEWRNAVVAEIGREQYEELSKELGGDLAFAYVDYRVEQMMIDRMAVEQMPKSSVEYILRKGAEGSLLGLAQGMMKSPLQQEIERRGEAAYRPSGAEKAWGTAVGVGMDTVMMGGISSWGSLIKLGGVEAVSYAVGKFMDGTEDAPAMTVEDCISRGVFGSEHNVFADFRAQGKVIKSYENPYILSLNERLAQKMGILTEKPLWAELMEAEAQVPHGWPFPAYEPPSNERKPGHGDVPMVVAPGREEEYLAMMQEEEEKERVETAKRETEKTATEQDNMADKHPTESGETQGKRNENGWGDLFGTFGLDGLDDIGQNLGYVISMLPDILFGLFTGKSKSLLPQNNLLPIASILTGMYVRNPMLKMVLIGMGGVNLLNKAGHEALGRQGNKVVQPYKVYADEPLNPRIANPVLQGNSLIAVIDKVPCSIQLTDNVVDAHRSGALPLNTLANTVLAKHDEMQQMAQQNYRAAEAERDEGRERTILLK